MSDSEGIKQTLEAVIWLKLLEQNLKELNPQVTCVRLGTEPEPS